MRFKKQSSSSFRNGSSVRLRRSAEKTGKLIDKRLLTANTRNSWRRPTDRMSTMSPDRELPDWLKLHVVRALLGEVYPSIRAVAAGLREDRILLLRYYLERAPEDADNESVEVVAANLEAMLGSVERVAKIDAECVHAPGPIGKLDPLGGFVYARREYDLDDFLVGIGSRPGHPATG